MDRDPSSEASESVPTVGRAVGAPETDAGGVGDLDRLLAAADRDDPGAQGDLFHNVYWDLHAIARRQVRSLPQGATLQPTALVNEAYLRLFGRDTIQWGGDKHFFFAAARAMHDITVEYARRRSAKKRGGDRVKVDLAQIDPVARSAESVLNVDAALKKLQGHDARLADIVRLRFFAGLTHEQVAAVMDLSVTKVRREWSYAKAWLRDQTSS